MRRLINKNILIAVSLLLFDFTFNYSYAMENNLVEQSNMNKQGRAWISGGIFDNQEVVYEEIDGYAVFEGDIIIGKVEDINAANLAGEPYPLYGHGPESNLTARNISEQNVQGSVIKWPSSRWPAQVIPYVIDSSISSSVRSDINAAISHWESRTSVNLVERTNQSDYVKFTSSTGCASWVGKTGGQQLIWLAPGCGVGAAIHEIGHAVGLWHEQSRADRDDWVTINWNNIQSGKEHNFNKHVSDGIDLWRYDYGSIMHYGRWDFSNGNGPTIVPSNPSSAQIGQRNGLSQTDIDTVNLMHASPNISIKSKTIRNCMGDGMSCQVLPHENFTLSASKPIVATGGGFSGNWNHLGFRCGNYSTWNQYIEIYINDNNHYWSWPDHCLKTNGIDSFTIYSTNTYDFRGPSFVGATPLAFEIKHAPPLKVTITRQGTWNPPQVVTANATGGVPPYTSYKWYRRPICAGGGGSSSGGELPGLPLAKSVSIQAKAPVTPDDVNCNAWYGPFTTTPPNKWTPYQGPNQNIKVIVTDSSGATYTAYSWAN